MSFTKSEQIVDVAIIGGGIAGLVCTIALAKKGIFAHVYESKSKVGEIGAGVGIGPNALAMLEDIGILEDTLKKCGEVTARMLPFSFPSGYGDHKIIHTYPLESSGQVAAGLPRAALVEALASHIDAQYIHFNKRCVNITPPEGTSSRSTAHFSDGSSISADIILIASGIRSAARSAVTGRDSGESVRYSGSIAYRGLVPADKARAAGVKVVFNQDRPLAFIGIDKHVIVYPIQGGQMINVAAFIMDRTKEFGSIQLPPEHPAVVPATVEEVLEEYKDWGPEVIALLSCLTQPNKWYIHVVYPALESYVNGKVALLGDAAHAMLPHLGAGAGQGIEDAYLMAKLLSHPQTTLSNVEEVLRIFGEVRRSRAQRVFDDSLRQGDNMDSRGEHGPSAEGIAQDLHGMYDFIWHYPHDEDYKKALARLLESGVYTESEQIARI